MSNIAKIVPCVLFGVLALIAKASEPGAALPGYIKDVERELPILQRAYPSLDLSGTRSFLSDLKRDPAGTIDAKSGAEGIDGIKAALQFYCRGARAFRVESVRDVIFAPKPLSLPHLPLPDGGSEGFLRDFEREGWSEPAVHIREALFAAVGTMGLAEVLMFDIRCSVAWRLKSYLEDFEQPVLARQLGALDLAVIVGPLSNLTDEQVKLLSRQIAEAQKKAGFPIQEEDCLTSLELLKNASAHFTGVMWEKHRQVFSSEIRALSLGLISMLGKVEADLEAEIEKNPSGVSPKAVEELARCLTRLSKTSRDKNALQKAPEADTAADPKVMNGPGMQLLDRYVFSGAIQKMSSEGASRDDLTLSAYSIMETLTSGGSAEQSEDAGQAQVQIAAGAERLKLKLLDKLK
jgi:hypothetical protein